MIDIHTKYMCIIVQCHRMRMCAKAHSTSSALVDKMLSTFGFTNLKTSWKLYEICIACKAHTLGERERDTVLKTLKSGSKQANGCAAGKHNKLNR